MKKNELQELVHECIAEVLAEKKSKGDDEFKRVDKGEKGKVAKDKGEEEVYGAGYAAGERAAKKKYKKLAEAYMALKEEGFGLNKDLEESSSTNGDIFDDIDQDLMHGEGMEDPKNQIQYLKDVISYCQSKINELESNLDEAYDGGSEDLAAMAKSSNTLRNKPETKELAKKAAGQAKSKEEAADIAVKLAKAKGIKDSEHITHIADLAASMLKKENIHNTAQMGGVTTSKGTAGYINNTSKQDKEYADSVRKGMFAVEKPNGQVAKYLSSEKEAQDWISKNDPDGMVDFNIRKV